MGLPGKSEGVVFCPVPYKIVCYEPERVGVAFLREAIAEPAPIRRDLEQVCHAAESLGRLLQQALEYVENVLVSLTHTHAHAHTHTHTRTRTHTTGREGCGRPKCW